jgi:hypothetical protein
MGQDEPPGIARATATPDTRGAKTEAAAADELVAVNPAMGQVVEAIRRGDVEGLLSLVDWRVETCGVRRDVSCAGAEKGEAIDVVNAGWPVAFLVPAETLRPSLEQALSGAPLQLKFASQLETEPSIYLLGFDGTEVKGKGLSPLADSSSDVTGLFLTLDAGHPNPIVLIETGISRQYSAIARGSELGFVDQRLIRFDDDYLLGAESQATPAAVPE